MNERALPEADVARCRAAARRQAEDYRGKIPDADVEALAASLERDMVNGLRWGIDPEPDGLV